MGAVSADGMGAAPMSVGNREAMMQRRRLLWLPIMT